MKKFMIFFLMTFVYLGMNHANNVVANLSLEAGLHATPSMVTLPAPGDTVFLSKDSVVTKRDSVVSAAFSGTVSDSLDIAGTHYDTTNVFLNNAPEVQVYSWKDNLDTVYFKNGLTRFEGAYYSANGVITFRSGAVIGATFKDTAGLLTDPAVDNLKLNWYYLNNGNRVLSKSVSGESSDKLFVSPFLTHGSYALAVELTANINDTVTTYIPKYAIYDTTRYDSIGSYVHYIDTLNYKYIQQLDTTYYSYVYVLADTSAVDHVGAWIDTVIVSSTSIADMVLGTQVNLSAANINDTIYLSNDTVTTWIDTLTVRPLSSDSMSTFKDTVKVTYAMKVDTVWDTFIVTHDSSYLDKTIVRIDTVQHVATAVVAAADSVTKAFLGNTDVVLASEDSIPYFVRSNTDRKGIAMTSNPSYVCSSAPVEIQQYQEGLGVEYQKNLYKVDTNKISTYLASYTDPVTGYNFPLTEAMLNAVTLNGANEDTVFIGHNSYVVVSMSEKAYTQWATIDVLAGTIPSIVINSPAYNPLTHAVDSIFCQGSKYMLNISIEGGLNFEEATDVIAHFTILEDGEPIYSSIVDSAITNEDIYELTLDQHKEYVIKYDYAQQIGSGGQYYPIDGCLVTDTMAISAHPVPQLTFNIETTEYLGNGTDTLFVCPGYQPVVTLTANIDTCFRDSVLSVVFFDTNNVIRDTLVKRAGFDTVNLVLDTMLINSDTTIYYGINILNTSLCSDYGVFTFSIRPVEMTLWLKDSVTLADTLYYAAEDCNEHFEFIPRVGQVGRPFAELSPLSQNTRLELMVGDSMYDLSNMQSVMFTQEGYLMIDLGFIDTNIQQHVTVFVYDNGNLGCETSDTIQFIYNPKPEFEFTTLYDTLCVTGQDTITVHMTNYDTTLSKDFLPYNYALIEYDGVYHNADTLAKGSIATLTDTLFRIGFTNDEPGRYTYVLLVKFDSCAYEYDEIPVINFVAKPVVTFTNDTAICPTATAFFIPTVELSPLLMNNTMTYLWSAENAVNDTVVTPKDSVFYGVVPTAHWDTTYVQIQEINEIIELGYWEENPDSTWIPTGYDTSYTYRDSAVYSNLVYSTLDTFYVDTTIINKYFTTFDYSVADSAYFAFSLTSDLPGCSISIDSAKKIEVFQIELTLWTMDTTAADTLYTTIPYCKNYFEFIPRVGRLNQTFDETTPITDIMPDIEVWTSDTLVTDLTGGYADFSQNTGTIMLNLNFIETDSQARYVIRIKDNGTLGCVAEASIIFIYNPEPTFEFEVAYDTLCVTGEDTLFVRWTNFDTTYTSQFLPYNYKLIQISGNNDLDTLYSGSISSIEDSLLTFTFTNDNPDSYDYLWVVYYDTCEREYDEIPGVEYAAQPDMTFSNDTAICADATAFFIPTVYYDEEILGNFQLSYLWTAANATLDSLLWDTVRSSGAELDTFYVDSVRLNAVFDNINYSNGDSVYFNFSVYSELPGCSVKQDTANKLVLYGPDTLTALYVKYSGIYYPITDTTPYLELCEVDLLADSAFQFIAIYGNNFFGADTLVEDSIYSPRTITAWPDTLVSPLLHHESHNCATIIDTLVNVIIYTTPFITIQQVPDTCQGSDVIFTMVLDSTIYKPSYLANKTDSFAAVWMFNGNIDTVYSREMIINYSTTLPNVELGHTTDTLILMANLINLTRDCGITANSDTFVIYTAPIIIPGSDTVCPNASVTEIPCSIVSAQDQKLYWLVRNEHDTLAWRDSQDIIPAGDTLSFTIDAFVHHDTTYAKGGVYKLVVESWQAEDYSDNSGCREYDTLLLVVKEAPVIDNFTYVRYCSDTTTTVYLHGVENYDYLDWYVWNEGTQSMDTVTINSVDQVGLTDSVWTTPVLTNPRDSFMVVATNSHCYTEFPVIVKTVTNPNDSILFDKSLVAGSHCGGDEFTVGAEVVIVASDNRDWDGTHDTVTYTWTQWMNWEVSNILTCSTVDSGDVCDTSFVIENTTQTLANYVYKLEVATSGYNCRPVKFETDTIKVYPTIFAQVTPSVDTICEGGSAYLDANVIPVDSNAPVYYQWYHNGIKIQGGDGYITLADINKYPYIVDISTPSEAGENEANPHAEYYYLYVEQTGTSVPAYCATRYTDSIRITVMNDPSVIITGEPNPDKDSAYTYTCNTMGGYINGPLTYQWYIDNIPVAGANDTTFITTFAVAGSHSVKCEVLQSCPGCSTVGEMNVQVGEIIVNDVVIYANGSSANTITSCQSVVLSTNMPNNGNYTYNWYCNDELVYSTYDPTFTATASCDYTVVILDGGDTVGMPLNNINVNIIPVPTVTIYSNGAPAMSTNVGLYGTQNYLTQTFDAHLDNADPASTYSYQWYINNMPINNGTSQTYVADDSLAVGTYYYTVVVTDDATGCTAVSNPVQANVVSGILVNIVGNQTYCEGATIDLTAVIENDQIGYNFITWMKDGNYLNEGQNSLQLTLTASDSTAGDYKVIISREGCEDTYSPAFTINVIEAPAVEIAGAVMCANGTAHLVASAYSSLNEQPYKWIWSQVDTATGTVISQTTTYTNTFDANAAGFYTVEAVYQTSACNSTSDLTEVLPYNNEFFASVDASTNTICDGGQVDLTVNMNGVPAGLNNPTYQWYENGAAVAGATMPTYSPIIFTGNASTTTYTYYVEVSYNDYPCAIASTPNVVTVEPNLIVTINGTQDVCEGSEINLHAIVSNFYDDPALLHYEWRVNGKALSTTDTALMDSAVLRPYGLQEQFMINDTLYTSLATDIESEMTFADSIIPTKVDTLIDHVLWTFDRQVISNIDTVRIGFAYVDSTVTDMHEEYMVLAQNGEGCVDSILLSHRPDMDTLYVFAYGDTTVVNHYEFLEVSNDTVVYTSLVTMTDTTYYGTLDSIDIYEVFYLNEELVEDNCDSIYPYDHSSVSVYDTLPYMRPADDITITRYDSTYAVQVDFVGLKIDTTIVNYTYDSTVVADTVRTYSSDRFDIVLADTTYIYLDDTSFVQFYKVSVDTILNYRFDTLTTSYLTTDVMLSPVPYTEGDTLYDDNDLDSTFTSDAYLAGFRKGMEDKIATLRDTLYTRSGYGTSWSPYTYNFAYSLTYELTPSNPSGTYTQRGITAANNDFNIGVITSINNNAETVAQNYHIDSLLGYTTGYACAVNLPNAMSTITTGGNNQVRINVATSNGKTYYYFTGNNNQQTYAGYESDYVEGYTSQYYNSYINTYSNAINQYFPVEQHSYTQRVAYVEDTTYVALVMENKYTPVYKFDTSYIFKTDTLFYVLQRTCDTSYKYDQNTVVYHKTAIYDTNCVYNTFNITYDTATVYRYDTSYEYVYVPSMVEYQ
ncbi:MAG: hypothetical protein J6W84_06025 [Bacteroidales bacterium]|nr:hypothetical protein [Bacteroidales bacterium]